VKKIAGRADSNLTVDIRPQDIDKGNALKNTAKLAIVAASVAGGLAFVAAPAAAAEPVVMAGAHCVANVH
jgi:hypothetical protein